MPLNAPIECTVTITLPIPVNGVLHVDLGVRVLIKSDDGHDESEFRRHRFLVPIS